MQNNQIKPLIMKRSNYIKPFKMKKSILLILFTPIIFILGCSESSENNDSLDFETLNVKFGGSMTDRPWTDGDEIGIFNTCTRNGEQNVPMSDNPNAGFKARVQGENVYFDEVS